MIVKVNAPPGGGNCTILPKRGVVMKTKWLITCENFKDDNGIIFYQFFGR